MKLKRKLLNTTMLRQSGIDPRRGSLRQKEKGRSMVEMLGVLAIIGVLTIGGIAGYRLAMNKYRANQTAGEINIIKEELRIQMLNGNQQVTLGEPYDKEEAGEGELKSYPYEISYGCGDGIYTYNDCQEARGYYIEVRGVEKRVCQPLRELLNYMPEKRELKVNGKEEEGCEEEENTLLLVMNDVEGESCPAGLTGEDCRICQNGNVYLPHMKNPCEKTVEGCISNNDCGTGEYCNLTGGYCEWPAKGTCTSITGKRDITVNGKIFRQSTYNMNWWGADNWCHAQGMRLVSLSELGCEAKNGECTSETLRGLREAGLSDWAWTNNAYSSCTVWHIKDDVGITRNGHNGGFTALCVGR